jgi:hypothetical protein
MASKEELKGLWVGWTRDAMARFEMPLEIEDEDELDDLVDTMADVSTSFADAMLEEYENRFEGGARRKRKKKSKDPDDDDPDDD